MKDEAFKKLALSNSFKDSGGEKLLQFIWRFQYYNHAELTTTTGEHLQILHPGVLNTNQGPDFLDAKLKIGNTILAGNLEVHLKTSQWYEHGHQLDPNYKNVILHVVYENDHPFESNIPVLELQSRISKQLLARYSELVNNHTFIPCAGTIHTVHELTWLSWKERLLAERLTRKAGTVLSFLKETNAHWEETFWWTLARNFGIKVNTEAFEAVARSLPTSVLAKHKQQIHQLEALLFGQAGLLKNEIDDEYYRLLQREYKFLSKKYQLQPVTIPILYLRMRPDNFPTIRLAQLAALVQNAAHLFSKALEARTLEELRGQFQVTANDYWHYHYKFGEPSEYKKKNLGINTIDNIFINTIIPVLYAYGIYHKNEQTKAEALEWLEHLASESNTVTAGFKNLSIPSKSAYDSQSLLELKHEYCEPKKCLNCAIGNAVLKIT